MIETLTVDWGIEWCRRLKPWMKEWAVIVVHQRDEFLHILEWWEEALLLEAGLRSTRRKHLILRRSAHHRCRHHARHEWRALVGLMTVVTETMDIVLTP